MVLKIRLTILAVIIRDVTRRHVIIIIVIAWTIRRGGHLALGHPSDLAGPARVSTAAGHASETTHLIATVEVTTMTVETAIDTAKIEIEEIVGTKLTPFNLFSPPQIISPRNWEMQTINDSFFLSLLYSLFSHSLSILYY